MARPDGLEITALSLFKARYEGRAPVLNGWMCGAAYKEEYRNLVNFLLKAKQSP